MVQFAKSVALNIEEQAAVAGWRRQNQAVSPISLGGHFTMSECAVKGATRQPKHCGLKGGWVQNLKASYLPYFFQCAMVGSTIE